MKKIAALMTCLLTPVVLCADALDGTPALGPLETRITQQELEAGMALVDVRRAGLKIFATPFNRADGYGDGEFRWDELDTTSEDRGGRPTLGNNGTFLRVNGLDAQTCVECHSVVSAATVPFTFGIGGSGGINTSPVFRATFIDVDGKDAAGTLTQGIAEMDGRLINPPALFGTGGVQLVAKEMTAELQSIRNAASERPGIHELIVKGVHFGYLVSYSDGSIDYSNIVVSIRIW
ncbi:MAG: hypothetical protein P8X98_11125 [Woeseiaceae bacterium]